MIGKKPSAFMGLRGLQLGLNSPMNQPRPYSACGRSEAAARAGMEGPGAMARNAPIRIVAHSSRRKARPGAKRTDSHCCPQFATQSPARREAHRFALLP
ncbi:MAG: hypothetical protein EBR09_14650, partial [Proteobacteria bacterium]|nr:hypothetical protein [Pseudomonadota bacterium]